MATLSRVMPDERGEREKAIETEGQDGVESRRRKRKRKKKLFLRSSFDLSLRYARICARARKRHAYAFGESRVVHRHDERWIKMKEEGKLKKSRGDAPRVGKAPCGLHVAIRL